MKTNKSNLSNLSKDIRSAVSLFAEFGSRGEYIHKGRTIVINDVKDQHAEGIFLARCARRIARKQGTAYAYEWALQAFTNGAYNRLLWRNVEHLTPRQHAIGAMQIIGADMMIKARELSGVSIKQAYSL